MRTSQILAPCPKDKLALGLLGLKTKPFLRDVFNFHGVFFFLKLKDSSFEFQFFLIMKMPPKFWIGQRGIIQVNWKSLFEAILRGNVWKKSVVLKKLEKFLKTLKKPWVFPHNILQMQRKVQKTKRKKKERKKLLFGILKCLPIYMYYKYYKREGIKSKMFWILPLTCPLFLYRLNFGSNMLVSNSFFPLVGIGNIWELRNVSLYK